MYTDTKRNGIRVRIVETGEEFNSIKACSDYLGVNAHWLGQVVKGNRGLRTCHGYHVVAVDNFDEDLYFSVEEHIGRPGVRVEIVETGERFNSITDCARHINGSAGTIHHVLNGERKSHKGYRFKTID